MPQQDWDVVDEASLESFPASDPPSSHRAAPALPERESEAEPRHGWRYVIAGFLALAGLFVWVRKLRQIRST